MTAPNPDIDERCGHRRCEHAACDGKGCPDCDNGLLPWCWAGCYAHVSRRLVTVHVVGRRRLDGSERAS